MGNKTTPKPVSWKGRLWEENASTGNLAQALVADMQTYTYTRLGSEDPKYRFKIAQNLNASGQLTLTIQNAWCSDADCTIYWRKAPSGPDFNVIRRSGHNGVFLGINEPLPISSHWASDDLAEARIKALTILQRKWTGRRRAVMGIAMVGELGKSVEMLIRPAKGLQNAVKTYIGRAKRLAKRTTRRDNVAKVIADTWLEAVFGWKPLIGDIQDAAKGLARVATRDALERHQFRAYAEVPKQISQSVGQTGSIGFSPWSAINYAQVFEKLMNSQVIFYGVWSTRLQDSSALKTQAELLIDRCGFRFEDWAPSAWELIPWSFFVDYFVNIGDVIEAASNTLDGPLWVENVDIVTSFDHRTFTALDTIPKLNMGSQFVLLDAAEISRWSEYKSVVRREYQWALQPPLHFRLPFGTQWLNIAALSAGARPPKPFY
jgi:hypothetical protein